MTHPAIDAFLQSRIVYCPGSGSDGHPISFFNMHRLANCFVFADYGVEEDRIKADLDNPKKAYQTHVRGYRSVDRLSLDASDLMPYGGWQAHVPNVGYGWSRPLIKPYAFLEVMERDKDLDDAHGAPHLYVLFIGADGHATYDALFCQDRRQRVPYAVMLQEHRFGSNYSKFGRGGLMEKIAICTGVWPEYLFVAENTEPWVGYVRVPEVEGSRSGMYGRLRHLYQRIPTA